MDKPKVPFSIFFCRQMTFKIRSLNSSVLWEIKRLNIKVFLSFAYIPQLCLHHQKHYLFPQSWSFLDKFDFAFFTALVIITTVCPQCTAHSPWVHVRPHTRTPRVPSHSPLPPGPGSSPTLSLGRQHKCYRHWRTMKCRSTKSLKLSIFIFHI